MNLVAAVKKASILALALCGLPHGSEAQVTKVGNAYRFRMKFAKNRKISYNVISSAQTHGGPVMKIEMPMTTTVKDVKGTTATLLIEIGPMISNGKPSNMASQVMEVTLDDRGKPIGDGAANVQGGIPNVGQLPVKPLSVGETFTSSNSLIAAGQKLDVKSVNKFLGIKRAGPRTVAVFSTTTSGSGAMKINGTGTAYLDMADCSLVSMNVTNNVRVGNGSQAQLIKNTMTVTRK